MGFSLLFAVIILPLTGILLIVWVLTRNKIFWKMLEIIWLAIIGLVIFVMTTQWLTAKTILDKEDYYGQYIIDRNFFPGKQADYQYNTFRFEIKDNDTLYFYLTDKERILQTYKGSITTNDIYISERLSINMQTSIHHILTSNPTTYRSAWNFYLVFYSPKFNNVYFKKGKWKSID
jgi:uncharacterized membrane protein YbhN (UPF0104 family)